MNLAMQTVFGLLLAASAVAQPKLLIDLVNGTTATYDLDSVQQITFSSIETLFVASSGTVDGIPLSSISEIHFDGLSTYLKDPSRLDHIRALFSNILPNPFSGSAEISFCIQKASHVKALLTDMKGRTLSTLSDSRLAAGDHKIKLNMKSLRLSAGTYFIRLLIDGTGFSNRVLFVN